MNESIKILDTNVLLDYPQIVTNPKEYWVIPMAVLMEIDGLKYHKSPEVAQKARKAAVYIAKNMANIEWDLTQDYSRDVDSVLLDITRKRNATLVTNDVALKVRAEVAGIDVEGYSWKDDYCGIAYLNVDDLSFDEYNEILGRLMQDGIYETDDYNFSINEYLIVPPPKEDASLGDISVFKYDGARFHLIRGKAIRNEWLGEIFPRNPEQICLVDALLSDVPIIYAGGHFGTG